MTAHQPAQFAEDVRYDHSQDHVPDSPECWDKCGDPDALSPVKKLHSPIQVEVVGWACANEDCDHDDVDDCLAAGGLATTCRHCHELREEANQWDEGLAILPWPCPTAALWFDGCREGYDHEAGKDGRCLWCGKALVSDGLRAADGHGHAGDKDNEEQPEFGHAPGIDKGDPSPAEALDPFGRDLAG